MPAGLTNARAAAYIDDSLGTSTRAAVVTPIKLHVETVAGSATAAGTDLASTTMPTITFGASTGTPPVASSTGTTTVVAGSSGTVVAIALTDSASVRQWFGPLASNRTVVAGDSLAFGAASVTTTITSP